MSVILRAIWGVFKGLPWQVYAAALVALTVWYAYHRGAESVRAEWEAQKKEDAQQVKEKTEQREKVTVRVETKYVDRIKVVHEKGETIYKLREHFVPTDSGMLDGKFRVFFDAATFNKIPDPAEIANAESVSVADVADTYAYNATQCNKAFTRLEGWQEWATEQLRLNEVDDGRRE